MFSIYKHLTINQLIIKLLNMELEGVTKKKLNKWQIKRSKKLKKEICF